MAWDRYTIPKSVLYLGFPFSIVDGPRALLHLCFRMCLCKYISIPAISIKSLDPFRSHGLSFKIRSPALFFFFSFFLPLHFIRCPKSLPKRPLPLSVRPYITGLLLLFLVLSLSLLLRLVLKQRRQKKENGAEGKRRGETKVITPLSGWGAQAGYFFGGEGFA